MTPESYATLQAELESRTNELKERISELEKVNTRHDFL